MKKIKNDDVRGEQEEEQTSSSPPVVKISATVFNIDSGLSFYEVRFRDKFGNYQTQLLNASKFLKPKQVVESLIDSHADLPDNAVAAQKIVKPALASKSSRVKRRTARSGFLDQHNFSYPGGSYGPLADTLEHAGAAEIDPALGLRLGSLDGWREGLREPCKFSDYLILACVIGPGSALLSPPAEAESKEDKKSVAMSAGVLFHAKRPQPSSGSRWDCCNGLRHGVLRPTDHRQDGVIRQVSGGSE